METFAHSPLVLLSAAILITGKHKLTLFVDRVGKTRLNSVFLLLMEQNRSSNRPAELNLALRLIDLLPTRARAATELKLTLL